ncbi:MAG: P44/Msp2 family outer membrane protein, partial [Anaplasma sp.]
MKNISRRMVSLGSLLVVLAAILPVGSVPSSPVGEKVRSLLSHHAHTESTGDFYVALSYNPVFGGIRDFKIREASRSAGVIIPYKTEVDGRVDLVSQNFDWRSPNFEINFADSRLMTLKGGLGYTSGRARFEVEIEHERFPVKKTKGAVVGRDKDADSVFFLSRKLVHSMARGRQEELSRALTEVTREKAKSFAKTVESDPRNEGPVRYASTTLTNLSQKICGTGSGTIVISAVGSASSVDKTNCRSGGTGPFGRDKGIASRNCSYTSCGLSDSQYDTLSEAFDAKDERYSGSNETWYTDAGNAFDGTSDKSRIKRDVAQTMAASILKLRKEEQGIVTEAFVQSIEGGAVAKIPAISSTSVTVNACYDLLSESATVVPYACAGVGGNFVSVVDG